MKNLFGALMKVQGEVVSVTKDSKGYNYTYASLPHVCETIYPILHKNGLVISQVLRGKELETILFHAESGEELKSLSPLEYQGNDSQKFGSALTYSRRYSLLAITGIPVEDDDGKKASEKDQDKKDQQAKQTSQNQPKQEKPKGVDTTKPSAVINATMYKNIVDTVKKHSIPYDAVTLILKNRFSKDDAKKLTVNEYEELIKELNTMGS